MNNTTEASGSKETSPCKEKETTGKQDVQPEQMVTGDHEETILDQKKVINKKSAEPAVFIPVDRSPEIQVCNST